MYSSTQFECPKFRSVDDLTIGPLSMVLPSLRPPVGHNKLALEDLNQKKIRRTTP